MSTRQISTLVSGGSFFEGPRWHDGAWYVSDFYRHEVLRIGTDASVETLCEVPGQPSGLGWLPDGSMLIVSMRDRRVLRLRDGQLEEFADLSALAAWHLNDMVVDRHGHAFVGNFGYDLMGGAPPATADLIRIDPDGRAAVVAHDLMFPNGSVITPDGGTLIVGETGGNRYTAFDLADDGSLSNQREWASFGPQPYGENFAEMAGHIRVAPDGCTLDAELHIWAADAFFQRVVRVAPGGEIVEEIPGPDGLGVYACQLGGPDGRTLLMCCAPDFFEHNRASTREAFLATTRVDVPHAGLP